MLIIWVVDKFLYLKESKIWAKHNTQKRVTFYTNNKMTQKEAKKAIPLSTAIKITITKAIKSLQWKVWDMD